MRIKNSNAINVAISTGVRVLMDRFNSSEDVIFHPEAESQGALARMDGWDMQSQNPYHIGSWMWRSFNAGWADVDAERDNLKAENERLTNILRSLSKCDCTKCRIDKCDFCGSATEALKGGNDE